MMRLKELSGEEGASVGIVIGIVLCTLIALVVGCLR